MRALVAARHFFLGLGFMVVWGATFLAMGLTAYGVAYVAAGLGFLATFAALQRRSRR